MTTANAAVKLKTETTTEGSTNPTNVELLLQKHTNELVKKGRQYYSEENGQGKFVDNYDDLMLPEGWTPEEVKRLDVHKTAMIAASALIHGEAQLENARKDPNHTSSSVAFKMGAHTVTHSWNRTGNARNPRTGEVTKTFSTVKTAVKFDGAKGTAGDLGRVRSHLQRLGASILV